MSITETAASVAARAFFYPSLAWNIARNKLQEDWHWWDEITEGVILGAIPFFSQLDQLKGLGVTAVVTLNEDFEVFITTEQYKEQGFTHLHIPTVDFLYAPPTADLHRGADFISDHVSSGNKTYVHCKAGRGRSTTLVLCYLIKYFNQDPEQAYAFVRQKRPQVYLAQGQWMAVCAFFCSCHPEEDLDPTNFPYPKFLPLAQGKQGSDGPEPSLEVEAGNSLKADSSSVQSSNTNLGSRLEEEKPEISQQQPVVQLEGNDEPKEDKAVNKRENTGQNRGDESATAGESGQQGKGVRGDNLQESCQPLIDSLSAALGACSIQSLPESGGTPEINPANGFTPPARVASPAISIPQSGRPDQRSNSSSKCSISIEPSGSLPGYIRIAPPSRRSEPKSSPGSVCSMSVYSAIQDRSCRSDVRSGFAEVCHEDEDWASVDSSS